MVKVPPKVQTEFNKELDDYANRLLTKTVAEIEGGRLAKMNENHDEQGRFSSGDGGGGHDDGLGTIHMEGPSVVANEKMHDESLSSPVTDDEDVALENMSLELGSGINNALRYGQPLRGNAQEVEATVAGVMARTSLSEDVVAYRGVPGFGWYNYKGLSVGDEFTDPGYVSTSLRSSVAGTYRDSPTSLGNSGKGGIITVEIPKGSKALPLGKTAMLSSGAEVLINKGTTYRVTAFNSKTRSMTVRVVTPVKKMNENHDEQGRFSSGDGGSNSGEVVDSHYGWPLRELDPNKIVSHDLEEGKFEAGDEAAVKKYEKLFSKGKEVEPIYVTHRNVVIDGSHRLLAARRLGLKTIKVWLQPDRT